MERNLSSLEAAAQKDIDVAARLAEVEQEYIKNGRYFSQVRENYRGQVVVVAEQRVIVSARFVGTPTLRFPEIVKFVNSIANQIMRRKGINPATACRFI